MVIPVLPAAAGANDHVLAVPVTEELVLYRLTSGQTPNSGDFALLGPTKAIDRSIPEIHRLGLSFYLSRAGAARNSTYSNPWVAEVRIPPSSRTHVARDQDDPEHVELWAPKSLNLTTLAGESARQRS
jgi:hypothetical protein